MQDRQPQQIVLRGGTIVDGTGQARYRADVRVSGDRIAEIGASIAASDGETVDAAGKVIAPGFIDVHTHDDQAVLSSPAMLPKISQGVTSVVVGNCGISLAPLVSRQVPPPLNLLGGGEGFVFSTMRDYAAAVDATRPAVNVAALIGHSTLRVATMKDPFRPATAEEQSRMVALAEEAMEAGATGLSSGVFYAPGTAADAGEIARLAQPVAAAGGIYATHIRSEGDRIIDSLDEAFAVGKMARLPVLLSHHKCTGPKNWGRTVETLAYIDKARGSQAVALDAYPYVAGSTILRPDLVDGVIEVLVTWSEPYPEMSGRPLAEIAREWGCSQKEACGRLQPGGACYFQMHEDDVRRVLKHPATMIGSDGLPHDKHPHPRLWGTFPRVLGRYARELGLFSLEEAIHRMSGLSARQFKLTGRGEIRVGNFADLTVFDPERVIDRSSFDRPMVPSEGIELVIVNGVPAYRDAAPTAERAGRFLRHLRPVS